MKPIIRANIIRESVVMTDEAPSVQAVGKRVRQPHPVHHLPTNTSAATFTRTRLKAIFSVFKRGMKGVYQHCAEKHLHRYLAEFDFRYNNRVALGVDDIARADRPEGHRRQAADLQATCF